MLTGRGATRRGAVRCFSTSLGSQNTVRGASSPAYTTALSRPSTMSASSCCCSTTGARDGKGLRSGVSCCLSHSLTTSRSFLFHFAFCALFISHFPSLPRYNLDPFPVGRASRAHEPQDLLGAAQWQWLEQELNKESDLTLIGAGLQVSMVQRSFFKDLSLLLSPFIALTFSL